MSARDKIIEPVKLKEILEVHKLKGRKIVFTNGCFDILHRGHVEYLEYSKSLGDVLVIGVNTDESVKRLKGAARPVNRLEDRMYILAALYMTDYITWFGEDTPYELIKLLKPDILVKAGDYRIDEVVGRDIVESYGGKVVIAPYLSGYSTTAIVRRIQEKEE